MKRLFSSIIQLDKLILMGNHVLCTYAICILTYHISCVWILYFSSAQVQSMQPRAPSASLASWRCVTWPSGGLIRWRNTSLSWLGLQTGLTACKELGHSLEKLCLILRWAQDNGNDADNVLGGDDGFDDEERLMRIMKMIIMMLMMMMMMNGKGGNSVAMMVVVLMIIWWWCAWLDDVFDMTLDSDISYDDIEWWATSNQSFWSFY